MYHHVTMVASKTKRDKIVELAKDKSILRVRDLSPHNIPSADLSQLCEEGKVQRESRGLYVLSEAAIRLHPFVDRNL